MTTGVLFDLDGTLVRFSHEPDKLEDLRARLISLWHATYSEPVPTRSIFGLYREAYQRDRGLARTMDTLIDDFESGLAGVAHPIVSGAALTRALAHWSPISLTGIVTNNGRPLVERLLSRGLLADLPWAVTITRSDGIDLKPSPEPLEAAVVGWKRTASDRLVFVGNSSSDRASLAAFDAKHGGTNTFVSVDELIAMAKP